MMKIIKNEIIIYIVVQAMFGFSKYEMNKRKVLKTGSVYDGENTIDLYTVAVFDSFLDAKKCLDDFSTEFYDDSNNHKLCITEYAIREQIYDLDLIIDECDNITNREECFKALLENHSEYDDFLVDYDYSEFSQRNFLARIYDYVMYPDSLEQQIFNDYFDAERWAEDKLYYYSEEMDDDCDADYEIVY